MFPTFTSLCPPIEGVSLNPALITPPGDVGMAAPRKTRVCVCEIGEDGTSDTSTTREMLGFDVKASRSMPPANAAVVGTTAPGEIRIGELNTYTHLPPGWTTTQMRSVKSI